MVIVDMHCHVLPGVDDGPSSMAESIGVLKEAQNQGVGAMIVTPHYHPGRYMVTADRVMSSLRSLKRKIADLGLTIHLYSGQECYYYSGLLDQLKNGNALSLAGSEYVLIEFEPNTLFSTITDAVRELTGAGYIPIIAHFERYACLGENKDRLNEIRQRGGMLQLNYSCLDKKRHLLRPNPWRKLLKDGYVDFLGSDTHGLRYRPLKIDVAIDWLESIDSEIRDRIMKQNIEAILDSAKH